MKYLLISLLVLFGCSTKESVTPKNNDSEAGCVTVVTIDGCQYLQYCQYMSKGITHKGNCNNPIHSYK